MDSGVKYLPSNQEAHRIVVLEYSDLINEDFNCSASIEAAFGYDGLGIVAIHGVPNLSPLRSNLLPLAHQ
jgi:hypothetical protein